MLAAQLPPDEARTGRAIRTDARIQIDGQLDEPAWQAAPIVARFLQKDPREGEPATEQTEVSILYTKTTLVLAIRCLDSDPSRILATELRRDNDFINDDTFSILLDTLHDHRNGYLLRINPLGTQFDALVTDEGRVVDANWNEVWTSVARVNEAGWTAEIEIPFKALRLNGDANQIWGLDFERVIRRKSEMTYWSNYRRGFEFTKVSQAGTLTGLSELDTGLKVRLKPFVRSTVAQPRSNSGFEAGIEDLKYRVTSDFTADFTVNTDFAEADVDAQVVNLTRFPVYFPETREFFVEGAGMFDYGAGGGASSEFRLFFSRTIGLSADRVPIPIIAGGKLTGKSRGWTVALLDVQTDAARGAPSRNFAVARVKKDILARSSVGAIFTNRDSASPVDPYNRGIGADAQFTFFEHWATQTYLASTYSPGKPDDHWTGRVRSNWDSDRLLANIEYGGIGPNVNPEMGWLPRKDIRKSKAQFDWKPRPESKTIRQWFFRSNMDYIESIAGTMETRTQDLTVESLLHSADRFAVRYSHLFDRIRRPFEIQGSGIRVLPGNYTWDAAQVRFVPSPSRALSGEVSVRWQPGFYGGDNTEVRWGPLWKASPNLSLTPAYQFNHVSLPEGVFTSHLINSQVNYAFNNKWLTTTTVQYNSLSKVTGLNFRLDFIHRPGDDFFLIYNDANTVIDGQFVGSRDRSLVAKLTRSWDF